MNGVDMIMRHMLHDANQQMLKEVKNGEVQLEKDHELVGSWIGANLAVNPDLLPILETMNDIVMEDMAQEYVAFFLNKIREIANRECKDLF